MKGAINWARDSLGGRNRKAKGDFLRKEEINKIILGQETKVLEADDQKIRRLS